MSDICCGLKKQTLDSFAVKSWAIGRLNTLLGTDTVGSGEVELKRSWTPPSFVVVESSLDG